MASIAFQVGALAALLMPAPGGTGPCSSQPAIEISHVQVIDVETGAVRPNATITIDSGRICRIFDGGAPASKARQHIDGRGRFAVPGFFANPARHGARDRAPGFGITHLAAGALPRDVTPAHLHDELARLVAQGHTPLQALQSVTVAPAARLQISNAGRLVEGFTASLVLLEGDPLQDVSNMRRVSLVVHNGRTLGLVELARARAGRSTQQPFRH